MGRLTDQIIRCMVGACDDTCKYYRNNACENNELMKEVEEKLKLWQHYEDLEEQGRLIELPCAVGDTVWWISRKEVKRARVVEIEWNDTAFAFFLENDYCIRFTLQEHEVYFTKEEAEAKLRDLLEIENVKVFKEKFKKLKELKDD